MNAMSVGLISLGCIFGGALFGLLVCRMLPKHHLSEDTKDTVKLGAGLIATLSALVLGLLVSSAKSSFDAISAGLTQCGAQSIQLDRVLARYGPETKDARAHLRGTLSAWLNRVWPEEKIGAGPADIERQYGTDALLNKLRELKPATDTQRELLAQAIDLSADLEHNRWLLVEEAQGSLPTAFLVVLIFWLAMLFASFGLFAPPNATVITVLFACAASVAAAIFLILEMNGPLDGLIKVSSSPLHKALEVISHMN